MSEATILLVDDDEVLGQVLQRVLSRQGRNVVQAGTVDQALRLAREHRPNLGLLDLCLPDGDGVDLAARLEAEVGRFPLILMTAYPLRLRDHPELARQFSSVLTKPLNLEELRSAVETALGNAPAPVEAPSASPAEGPRFDPAKAALAPRAPAPAAPEAAAPPELVHAGAAPEGAPEERRRPRLIPALLGLGILLIGLLLVLPVLGVPGIPNVLHLLAEKPKDAAASGPSSVRMVKGKADTFDLDPDTVKELQVRLAESPVAEKALPRLLEMSGSLAFNPNRLAKIQARFQGEVVELGTNEIRELAPGGTTEPSRPLNYGDRVFKGQLLAVVWSKDLGEKKSELVDSLVKLHLDEENLKRFEDAADSVPEAVIRGARSAVSGDLNAIARGRQTLRTWRVEEKEIKEVEAQAARIIASKTKRDLDKLDKNDGNKNKWARVEVRAPFDGVIVEKNVTINAIIDTTFDLYKLADMGKLAVFANAYEEDLRLLQDEQARRLPERVPWRLHLTADSSRKPLKGLGKDGQTEIDRIGYIVDPNQHTNLVIGLANNADGRMRVGQFVTASVRLPPPLGVVSVPSSALVEDGKESALFVQADPKKPRYTLKRVVVTHRFQDMAYVRSQLSAEQKKAGLSEVKPGEWLVTGGAIELKAAMEEVQAKAKAKEREKKEKEDKEKVKGKKGK